MNCKAAVTPIVYLTHVKQEKSDDSWTRDPKKSPGEFSPGRLFLDKLL